MKYILLLLLAFATRGNAQDTAIVYHDVITVDSLPKAELFVRARQWLNKTFVDSKEVIQIADKETGELAGKGNMKVVTLYKIMGTLRPQNYLVKFACNIWVKDGRYKFEFKNFDSFTQTGDPAFGILTSSDETPVKISMVRQSKTNGAYKDLKLATEEKVMTLIESLKAAMSVKSASDF